VHSLCVYALFGWTYCRGENSTTNNYNKSALSLFRRLSTCPVFAAEWRRLQHSAHTTAWLSVPAAIDRYFLSAGRSAAKPPAAVAAVDRWDRKTDVLRCIDPASHIKPCGQADKNKMPVNVSASIYFIWLFHWPVPCRAGFKGGRGANWAVAQGLHN